MTEPFDEPQVAPVVVALTENFGVVLTTSTTEYSQPVEVVILTS